MTLTYELRFVGATDKDIPVRSLTDVARNTYRSFEAAIACRPLGDYHAWVEIWDVGEDGSAELNEVHVLSPALPWKIISGRAWGDYVLPSTRTEEDPTPQHNKLVEDDGSAHETAALVWQALCGALNWAYDPTVDPLTALKLAFKPGSVFYQPLFEALEKAGWSKLTSQQWMTLMRGNVAETQRDTYRDALFSMVQRERMKARLLSAEDTLKAWGFKGWTPLLGALDALATDWMGRCPHGRDPWTRCNTCSDRGAAAMWLEAHPLVPPQDIGRTLWRPKPRVRVEAGTVSVVSISGFSVRFRAQDSSAKDEELTYLEFILLYEPVI